MQSEDLESKSTSKLHRLVILGSISSIAALAVVILDKVAAVGGISPQLAGWRFVFFVFSILGIAGTALFTYHWARLAYTNTERALHINIIYATLRTLIGTLVVGVFIDAFFAAVYWTVWMKGVVLFGRNILNF